MQQTYFCLSNGTNNICVVDGLQVNRKDTNEEYFEKKYVVSDKQSIENFSEIQKKLCANILIKLIDNQMMIFLANVICSTC